MFNWKKIRDICIFTEKGVQKKLTEKEPSDSWKKSILLAEHSPIRTESLIFTLEKVPSFVQNHLVRHKIGIEFFVHTSRPDRGGKPRDEQLKTDPCDIVIMANLQAIINISRKRLCNRTEKETKRAWQIVIDAINEVEPIVYSVCVPECIYRGFCPEGKRSCGYDKTEEFKNALEDYRRI